MSPGWGAGSPARKPRSVQPNKESPDPIQRKSLEHDQAALKYIQSVIEGSGFTVVSDTEAGDAQKEQAGTQATLSRPGSLSPAQRQSVSAAVQILRGGTLTELGSAKQEVSMLKHDLRDEVRDLKHALREMKATVEIYVHQSQPVDGRPHSHSKDRRASNEGGRIRIRRKSLEHDEAALKQFQATSGTTPPEEPESLLGEDAEGGGVRKVEAEAGIMIALEEGEGGGGDLDVERRIDSSDGRVYTLEQFQQQYAERAADLWANAGSTAELPAPPELLAAHGWEVLQDQEGRDYYYRAQTADSRWERPSSSELVVAAAAQGHGLGTEPEPEQQPVAQRPEQVYHEVFESSDEIVVVDCGSCYTKVGRVRQERPHKFRSVIGHVKAAGGVGSPVILLQRATTNGEAAAVCLDHVVGAEAISKRHQLQPLRCPVLRGLVQDWDGMEKIWRHAFLQVEQVGAARGEGEIWAVEGWHGSRSHGSQDGLSVFP